MKLKDAIILEKTVEVMTGSGVLSSMVTTTSMDSYLAKPKTNPMVGRITKRTKSADVYLYQGRYENLVNNRRDKQGLEKTFEAEVPRGMHHLEGHPLLLQSDKDENKYYLRVYYPRNENTRSHVEFFLDGQPTTLDDVKEFLVPSYFTKNENKSQGLGKKPILVNSITLENIDELKVGTFHFSK